MTLTWQQIDFHRGLIALRDGETKNDEGRVLPLVGKAFDLLKERAKVRCIDSPLEISKILGPKTLAMVSRYTRTSHRRIFLRLATSWRHGWACNETAEDDLSSGSRHRLTCRTKKTPRNRRGAGKSLLHFGAWNRLLGNKPIIPLKTRSDLGHLRWMRKQA